MRHAFGRLQARNRAFTLVEILAAMGVLVLLTLVLFRFFAAAERVWTLSEQSTEVYEKARIVLDLISRDLQGAVARSNDVPGLDIHFEQLSNHELRFVTASALGSTATSTSRLCEVGYQLDGNDFERARQNDACASWNIYGSRLSRAPDDQDGYQRVVDCVLEQQYVCYDETFAPQTWQGANYATKLPFAVSVSIRLMDNESFRRWQQLAGPARTQLESEVSRTFAKVIFLADRN